LKSHPPLSSIGGEALLSVLVDAAAASANVARALARVMVSATTWRNQVRIRLEQSACRGARTAPRIRTSRCGRRKFYG